MNETKSANRIPARASFRAVGQPCQISQPCLLFAAAAERKTQRILQQISTDSRTEQAHEDVFQLLLMSKSRGLDSPPSVSSYRKKIHELEEFIHNELRERRKLGQALEQSEVLNFHLRAKVSMPPTIFFAACHLRCNEHPPRNVTLWSLILLHSSCCTDIRPRCKASRSTTSFLLAWISSCVSVSVRHSTVSSRLTSRPFFSACCSA